MRPRWVLVVALVGGSFGACSGSDSPPSATPSASPSPVAEAPQEQPGTPVGFVAFEEGERLDVVDSCRNEAGDLVAALPDGGAFFLIGAEAELFHVNLLPDGGADPLFTDADAPVELVISGGTASGEAAVLKTEGGTERAIAFAVPWEQGGPGCRLDTLEDDS